MAPGGMSREEKRRAGQAISDARDENHIVTVFDALKMIANQQNL
jgi:hypothetical protein